MAKADDVYHDALVLYRDTALTLTEISVRCGVSRAGLAGYIRRCHRDLMLRRNGIPSNASSDKESGIPPASSAAKQDADMIRLRGSRGQTPVARQKYREAILACDSGDYIDMNVSQIARVFGVNNVGLANQLRSHYPEIIERREAVRRRLGIADNARRGVREASEAKYAEAVALMSDPEVTVEEAARQSGVRLPGLRQYLMMKGMWREGRPGNGNAGRKKPRGATEQKYASAVAEYRKGEKTIKAIAEEFGVNAKSFAGYLRRIKK